MFDFNCTEVFSDFARSLRLELDFEKPKSKATKKKSKQKKKKEVEETPEEEEIPPFKLSALSVSVEELQKIKADPIQIEPIDLKFIDSENDVIKLVCESITAFTEKSIVKIHNECIKGALVELIDGTKDEDVENAKHGKKKGGKAAGKSTARGEIIYHPKDKEIAYVCPVWTPPTPRAHASILYLYFRRVILKKKKQIFPFFSFKHFESKFV